MYHMYFLLWGTFETVLHKINIKWHVYTWVIGSCLKFTITLYVNACPIMCTFVIFRKIYPPCYLWQKLLPLLNLVFLESTLFQIIDNCCKKINNARHFWAAFKTFRFAKDLQIQIVFSARLSVWMLFTYLDNCLSALPQSWWMYCWATKTLWGSSTSMCYGFRAEHELPLPLATSKAWCHGIFMM